MANLSSGLVPSRTSSPISVSASGDNTIVAAQAGKQIVVMGYSLICDGAVTVKWRNGLTADGTGTDLTGAMSFGANSGIVEPESSNGHFSTDVGKALVMVLGGATGVRGKVQYLLQ